jgi:hypothetical protein
MRHPLPDRRHQITERIAWALYDGTWETKIYVSAGIDPQTGALREVFLRGAGKVGSERDFLFDDIAVCLSRDLQHGDRLCDMAAGMGRFPDGKPASLVGAIIDTLVKIEADVKGIALPPPQPPSNVVVLDDVRPG